MSEFKLLDFQVDDVVKLVKAGNGANGNEMGSGKTHEAIACDQAWYKLAKVKAPTLVVCPVNVFDSWVEKYKWQSPDTDVYVIDRKKRHLFIEAIKTGKADVYICNWDSLRLMPELKRIRFLTVIADEAHHMANRKAQATQALKGIPTTHKLAMSGTLSGDQPQNLWSILNWLWPKTYTSYWKFRKHHVVEGMDPSGKYRVIQGVQNVESLKKEMSSWFVRHLKMEQCCEHHPKGIMPELPPKTYDTIWVELNPTQRRVYEQMKRQMVAWIGEQQDTPLVATIAAAKLVRLQQIALATPEIKIEPRKKRLEDGTFEIIDVQVVHLKMPSTKFEAVLELLKDNPNKKFVLWSASKKFCYLMSKELGERGIGSYVLSGDTPAGQRRSMVRDFVAGDRQCFIGVIQAAGEGIDGLQEATDTAIFLDRSWSTKQNKQAEDRLHRPGQKGDHVHTIDVMARDTVDLGRNQRLEEKWVWIKAILGDKVNQATGEIG